MRLSVITDEVSQDLGEAVCWMSDLDIEAAELRGLWGANIASISDADVARAKGLLNDYGRKVCCIASPFYKCGIDAATTPAGPMHLAEDKRFDEQLAVLDRCLALANEFHAPFVRIFSFWRTVELTAEVVELLASRMEEPIRRAEKAGVVLVLENEHSCILGTGEETARLLRKVDSPWLRACWDPGNAFCAGEAPFPRGYEAIRPFVNHVHLKDAVKSGDKTRFVIMGEGEIAYVPQFRALGADGYSGYLSLETHARTEGQLPAETSRRCIEAVRRLMEMKTDVYS